MPISGASFCTTCNVRQSKDRIVVRSATPASRMAAISARANGSGAIVSSGAFGVTLVSSAKRTSVLPAFFTSANSSTSFGRRVPSTGFCAGYSPA